MSQHSDGQTEPIVDEAVANADSTAICAEAEKQKHDAKFTPDEFASLMRKIEGDGDIEGGHGEADELMSELLDSLGYHEGVAVFQSMSKWYA